MLLLTVTVIGISLIHLQLKYIISTRVMYLKLGNDLNIADNPFNCTFSMYKIVIDGLKKKIWIKNIDACSYMIYTGTFFFVTTKTSTLSS